VNLARRSLGHAGSGSRDNWRDVKDRRDFKNVIDAAREQMVQGANRGAHVKEKIFGSQRPG